MLSEKNTTPLRGSVRSNVWGDLCMAAAIFLAASALVGLCAIPVASMAPDLDRKTVSAITYIAIFAIAIPCTAIRYFRRGGKPLFRLSVSWLDAPVTLWGIVLTVASSIAIEPLMALFPQRYFDRLNEAVGNGNVPVVLLVVFAPILEEIFFRGLVLEQTSRRWRAWQAVGVSALLFGLVHLPFPPQMANALFMGIVMGYLYLQTRSLIPVILVHAVNNGIAWLLLETTGSQNTGTREMIGNDSVYGAVFAASVVVTLASLVWMVVSAERKDTKRGKSPLNEKTADHV